MGRACAIQSAHSYGQSWQQGFLRLVARTRQPKPQLVTTKQRLSPIFLQGRFRLACSICVRAARQVLASPAGAETLCSVLARDSVLVDHEDEVNSTLCFDSI